MKSEKRFTLLARQTYLDNPNAVFKTVSSYITYEGAIRAAKRVYGTNKAVAIIDKTTGRTIASGSPALGVFHIHSKKEAILL